MPQHSITKDEIMMIANEFVQGLDPQQTAIRNMSLQLGTYIVVVLSTTLTLMVIHCQEL